MWDSVKVCVPTLHLLRLTLNTAAFDSNSLVSEFVFNSHLLYCAAKLNIIVHDIFPTAI
ncbi:hypothetical protein EXN66_Car010968 [Channa argus]|uniref:Uncharacterized protein n=1 Tax=Channa argus TaxID=215402 RepID=A0A6G1PYE6_CHAAH|nr:hypothetical protein EXN66_Car010968 [Channa argus]